MKGQWIGPYTGSTDGLIIVNVDERPSLYQEVAYLNESDETLPSTAAFFRTQNKDKDFRFRTDLVLPGILFISIWLYVSICQIYFLLNPIKEKLRKEMSEYREVKNIWLFGDPNFWLGIVFPLFFAGIWILFMIGE